MGVGDLSLSEGLDLTTDILKTCKGRDKLCAFLQNLAKYHSVSSFKVGTEEWQIWRNVENSMSDGRKIFKLFKFIPEATKCKNARTRATKEERYFALRSNTEAVARAVSCVYFGLDNVMWAASVGIFASKDQRHAIGSVDDTTGRKDGAVIGSLGGLRGVADKKNTASLYRLLLALLSEGIWLVHVLSSATKPKDTDSLGVLAHVFEVITLTSNLRMVMKRLYKGSWELSPASMGILGMVAAASVVCKITTERLRKDRLRR